MKPEIRQALAGRSGGVCEARLPMCTGRAMDAQHRKSKKFGGRRRRPIDDLSNLAHLCRPCHRWAHGNPTEAHDDFGLVVWDYEDPRLVPMRLRGRLVWLDDLGGYSDSPPEGVAA